MKKLIFLSVLLAMLFAGTPTVMAQVPEFQTKQGSDTNINAATTYLAYNSIRSKIMSIQATVTKVSGTLSTSSYVLLQGNNDGTNWQNVNTDTLKLVDQATNFKIWPITATHYYSYRLKYVSASSTQRSVLRINYLRRPDD